MQNLQKICLQKIMCKNVISTITCNLSPYSGKEHLEKKDLKVIFLSGLPFTIISDSQDIWEKGGYTSLPLPLTSQTLRH